MLSQFVNLLNIKIKWTFALNALHMINVPIEFTSYKSTLIFSRCSAPAKLPTKYVSQKVKNFVHGNLNNNLELDSLKMK